MVKLISISKDWNKLMVKVLPLLFSLFAYAQPSICSDPAIMTPTCAAACIICDIDGFTGINNGGSVGEAPPDFCTKEVHNARWIAFMAGSTNLKIQLSVSNCQSGRGLELAIYESTDCRNFRMISNCLGSENAVGPGESGIFTTTEPLVIGQYYYIVMDGSKSDVCNWSFKVLEGSTKVSPLTVTNPIIGEIRTCPKSGYWYRTTKIVGAIDYDWTLNGKYIGSGDSIYVDWPLVGEYNLYVTASNVCDVADEVCQTIIVREIPITEIDTAICEGTAFTLADGTSYSKAGLYTKTYTSSANCDSNVIVNLDILPHSSDTFNYRVCQGDSFPWLGDFLTKAGVYGSVQTSTNGCDSSVGLVLEVIDCELDVLLNTIDPRCYGESNGEIGFEVSNGVPPFSYEWNAHTTMARGSGSNLNANEKVLLINLSADWYTIYICDAIGNDVALQIELVAPDSLVASVFSSDYNGVAVSCFGASDGSVEVLTTGGTPMYRYTWESGDTARIRDSLGAGFYQVEVKDDNGCETKANVLLVEPDSLVGQFVFNNPECFMPSSGSIFVSEVAGGTETYTYTLNDNAATSKSVFENLVASSYTVTISDMNGCSIDSSNTLVSPTIASIEAFGDTSVFLGDTISLRVTSDIPLSFSNTRWTPGITLLCDTCPQTKAIPNFSRHYLVSVSSVDECISYDSIYVDVTARGRIFVPTAFTPNSDGLNETFYVLGGSEILEISSFMIFNRWGEKIYGEEHLSPHQSQRGWDGTYKGVDVQQDVYVWVAQVEYIDNRIFTYKGTVTLLR